MPAVIRQFIETPRRKGVARDWGREEWELMFNGHRVLAGGVWW